MKDELGAITVQEFISSRLRQLGRSVEEVSVLCGWDAPQRLGLILEGVTKLPAAGVVDLAFALDVHAEELAQVTMQEYMPDTWAMLLEVFTTLSYSSDEQMIIERVREHVRVNGGTARVVDAKGVIAMVMVEP